MCLCMKCILNTRLSNDSKHIHILHKTQNFGKDPATWNTSLNTFSMADQRCPKTWNPLRNYQLVIGVIFSSLNILSYDSSRVNER